MIEDPRPGPQLGKKERSSIDARSIAEVVSALGFTFTEIEELKRLYFTDTECRI